MKIITRKLPLEQFEQSLSLLDKDMIFTDIETTGFKADSQQIYMIGTAFLQEDDLCVRLFFAENPSDEQSVLREYIRLLTSFKKIITFNGDRFDLPFISARLDHHNIPKEALTRLVSIDLYKAFRPFYKLLGLSSCRQKDVETFLGIEREDEMDGGKLIDVYRDHVKNPSCETEKLLILHNEEDVCGMVSILPVISYSKIKSSSLSIDSLEIDYKESIITATISMDVSVPAPVRIRSEAFYMIIENSSIRAAFYMIKETLKYYFPYPAQYVYLIRENSVIPKMLASTVPAEEKRPAKAAECFTSVFDTFLAIDSCAVKKRPDFLKNTHLFQKEYNGTEYYIKTDSHTPDEETILKYASLLLNQYL